MMRQALKVIARLGYATRGLVYLIVGGLAVFAVFGAGGETTDAKGGLLTLLETGYGTVLLSAMAVGLACYALWRLLQALLDTDRHGWGAKGLVVRAGLLTSAGVHAALGLWAISVAVGEGGGGSGSGSNDIALWLMQQPYGHWLVAGLGVVIIGVGLAHLDKGVRRRYEKWLVADAAKMALIRPISTVGLIARGVVFLIVGGLFVYAGLTVDADEAGGMSAALQWLRRMPFGPALLLVTAVGLVCFGIYSLIEAFFRRIDAPAPPARKGPADAR